MTSIASIHRTWTHLRANASALRGQKRASLGRKPIQSPTFCIEAAGIGRLMTKGTTDLARLRRRPLPSHPQPAQQHVFDLHELIHAVAMTCDRAWADLDPATMGAARVEMLR
jgi:hypothetical protein